MIVIDRRVLLTVILVALHRGQLSIGMHMMPTATQQRMQGKRDDGKVGSKSQHVGRMSQLGPIKQF
jgi:hypothetical protein